MAILMIRIPNKQSLSLNEFFDYNNHCYAITRDCPLHETVCIDMEDFYEASFLTQEIKDIPVLFVYQSTDGLELLGWYKKATVFRQVQRISLFLQGNVVADASEVVRLAKPILLSENYTWQTGSQLYEVIEKEDPRYQKISSLTGDFNLGAGQQNVFLRYPYVRVSVDPKAMKDFDACISNCDQFAALIMQNECEDIRGIKALETYARQASSLKRSSPDGCYYLAMACDQLGFVKQGMKAIEKAIRLEPDASDLHGQKASLLVGMGYLPQAAEEYHLAYTLSGEEDYLLMEGKVWMIARQIDKGYACLRSISDSTLVAGAEIRLDEIERRWAL